VKRRVTSRKITLAIVAGCFLCFSFVSAVHWHSPTAGASVKTECQICSLGQSPVDVRAAGPLLLGGFLLGCVFALSAATRPSIDLQGLAAPRAPPLR
jgi:hypothetical protein